MNAPTQEVAANETAALTQGHFKGIAVVIDDEVESEAEIGGIVQAIKDAGGHVITMKALPDDATDLDNFAGAAFFILDWNSDGRTSRRQIARDPRSRGVTTKGRIFVQAAGFATCTCLHLHE